MSTPRTLAGLITAAALRYPHTTTTWPLAVEAMRLAELGLFDQLKRLTRLSVLMEEFLARQMFAFESDRLIHRLQEDSDWQEFHSVCELADRVDHFLAAVECARMARELGRACRADLNLLPILADWFEDQGRPAVAQEARYLLALVIAAEFASFPPRTDATLLPADEEDDSLDDEEDESFDEDWE
jgi:hypothetical protein